eukprot:TRINITY_DN15176_c0_g1_i1.p1 TRINITY_DN15176_c0_g1~~TRINITY_DN15176_c0_g1_i1.p1  ORF type:complete len:472 (+),score=136.55 TRINITY_DN15176_c0_g1_i1:117-1532(+)
MDDEAALAAIAQSIAAAGGARCAVCLNHLAQPYCGMTGRPHPASQPLKGGPTAAGALRAAAPAAKPVASSSSCPQQGARQPKPRHACYKDPASFAATAHADPRVFPHLADYPPPAQAGARGASRFHARCHAYLAHHHATHHERQRGGVRFPAEILHAVYSYLLPWDALRLRLVSRRTHQASLHPHLWKDWVAAVQSLDTLRIPDVFFSDTVRRAWAQGLPKPRARPDLTAPASGDYELYKHYARAGVLRWRFDLEGWVPASVAGLRKRQAMDIVNGVVEAELCWAQVPKLTMVDVDDLHDVLSRLCAALSSMSDVYLHIRPKNRKQHMAGFAGLLHRLREDVNLLTKIDQWMNCVTDNKFWDLLRIQVYRIGLVLPLTPSDCLVTLVMSMFADYPDSFKPIWDITISAANDAFESEHGFESTSSLPDGVQDAASSVADAGTLDAESLALSLDLSQSPAPDTLPEAPSSPPP